MSCSVKDCPLCEVLRRIAGTDKEEEIKSKVDKHIEAF